MHSPRFRATLAASIAAAVLAALALAPLLRVPAEGRGARPAWFGEREQGEARNAGGGSPPPPASADFAPAPRPDPSYPVGVELCLPSEHYKPANPPVAAGVNPAVVTEVLRARLHVADAVEQDLSVRWRGDPEQPFEAVFEFYRRGDWANYQHSCTLLQDAAGRWSIIDYTVQKVSPREDEPVVVLNERSSEWRALLARMN